MTHTNTTNTAAGMTAEDFDAILDDLIFTWLQEPTYAELCRLCRLAPAHADALGRFGANHHYQETLRRLTPEPPPLTADEEARFVAGGRQLVQQLLADRKIRN